MARVVDLQMRAFTENHSTPPWCAHSVCIGFGDDAMLTFHDEVGFDFLVGNDRDERPFPLADHLAEVNELWSGLQAALPRDSVTVGVAQRMAVLKWVMEASI